MMASNNINNRFQVSNKNQFIKNVSGQYHQYQFINSKGNHFYNDNLQIISRPWPEDVFLRSGMWARTWRQSGGRTASTDSGHRGQAQPPQHGQALPPQNYQAPLPRQQQEHGQQRHQETQGRTAKKRSPSPQSQPG